MTTVTICNDEVPVPLPHIIIPVTFLFDLEYGLLLMLKALHEYNMALKDARDANWFEYQLVNHPPYSAKTVILLYTFFLLTL